MRLRLMILAFVSCVGWFSGPVACASESDAPFDPNDHVFVELAVERDRYVVGQPMIVRVRVGYDADFLRDHAIQLFRRELEVPVQLLIRAIEEMPGVTPVAAEAGDASGSRKTVTLAVDDGVARAERVDDVTRAGRTWSMVELVRRFRADTIGVLEVPAPRLRFAYATRFEESFIGGRTPLDRYDAEIVGEALRVTVEGLPEAERPAAFTGGIGSFTIAASAEPRSLTAGETLELELRIEGEGNVPDLEAPRLDDLEGFHVYGHVEREATGARVFAYDVSPLRGSVTAVPAIAFAFFDPAAGAYRTVMSEPVPLEVAPGPDDADEELAASDTDDTGRGNDDAYPDASSADEVVESNVTVGRIEFAPTAIVLIPVLVVLGVLIAWWVASRRGRRRAAEVVAGTRAGAAVSSTGGPPSAADLVAARGAAGVFRRQIAAPAADPAIAVVSYLAARLHCASAAVVDPRLAGRLTEAGISSDLSARAGAWVEAAYGARYGGSASGIDRAGAEALVGDLEAEFSKIRS